MAESDSSHFPEDAFDDWDVSDPKAPDEVLAEVESTAEIRHLLIEAMDQMDALSGPRKPPPTAAELERILAERQALEAQFSQPSYEQNKEGN